MSLRKSHELHQRRFGRNLGVGLTLAAFIVIIFGLTIVKVSGSDFGVSTEEVQN
ncbi:hypothetical protein [Ruegeria arenilitoris]|uniref:Cytochrome C oxidase assembly protein n=1 Tax=Ruegeria arenilitoris TaxID=1173585 RepID=A0A238K228_9RHOB|nr:hypothetical protein [Ruegeria arenilitoris]SMX36162.1 hypothetical protein RUA8715_01304 [Ruegeria arenilitoris]